VEGEEEEEELGTKRNLTSPVWKEFKRVKCMGVVRENAIIVQRLFLVRQVTILVTFMIISRYVNLEKSS
jgi:hypothetical protein